MKDDLKWEVEDFSCNVELSEEEQARLLEEYEQEIQEREQRSSKSDSSDILIKEEIKTQQKNENSKVNIKKPAQKNSNQNKKNSNNLPSSTVSNKTKNNSGKVTKSAKQSSTIVDAGIKDDKKNEKKDADLEINKNHFTKDEISSNSDESWEKEFDLDGN